MELPTICFLSVPCKQLSGEMRFARWKLCLAYCGYEVFSCLTYSIFTVGSTTYCEHARTTRFLFLRFYYFLTLRCFQQYPLCSHQRFISRKFHVRVNVVTTWRGVSSIIIRPPGHVIFSLLFPIMVRNRPTEAKERNSFIVSQWFAVKLIHWKANFPLRHVHFFLSFLEVLRTIIFRVLARIHKVFIGRGSEMGSQPICRIYCYSTVVLVFRMTPIVEGIFQNRLILPKFLVVEGDKLLESKRLEVLLSSLVLVNL